jgi:hypothetical protein
MAGGKIRSSISGAKPGSDAYTGILALSLLGMIAGCVFLFLDYQDHSGKPPGLPAKPSMAQQPANQPPPGGGNPGNP